MREERVELQPGVILTLMGGVAGTLTLYLAGATLALVVALLAGGMVMAMTAVMFLIYREVGEVEGQEALENFVIIILL